MTDWVRLWHDMPTDPKWRVIARKSGQPLSCVIALFTLMMTTASAADDRGSIDGLNVEDAAAALDMDEDEVSAILEAMQDRVVSEGRLSGWDRRQPKREDDSAQRVREFRKRNAEKSLETKGNVRKRNVTQRNAPDTDKIREDNTPLPPTGEPSIEDRTVSFWNAESAGTPLPQARTLNDQRVKHLKARISEHGEDAVFQAIRNMVASDFHSGRDGKWTEGNLGWLLKSPENFQKMLERQAPERKPVVIDHSVYDRLKAKGYDTAASTASGGERRSESTGPPRQISQLIPKFGSM